MTKPEKIEILTNKVLYFVGISIEMIPEKRANNIEPARPAPHMVLGLASKMIMAYVGKDHKNVIMNRFPTGTWDFDLPVIA